VIAEELKRNVIDLEGHLIVVEVGHTDTDYTTCLQVPSVGLVVAGDAAYTDVHLYLAESNVQSPPWVDRGARKNRVTQPTRCDSRTQATWKRRQPQDH
jgi:hypothetical protein